MFIVHCWEYSSAFYRGDQPTSWDEFSSLEGAIEFSRTALRTVADMVTIEDKKVQ